MYMKRLQAWGSFLLHEAHQGDAVGRALQRVQDGSVQQLFRGIVQELQAGWMDEWVLCNEADQYNRMEPQITRKPKGNQGCRSLISVQ